jgi:hypothetical protein
LDGTVLEGLTASILDALARGESVGPVALLFLLRRFSAGDAILAEPLGGALASALDRLEAGFEDEGGSEQWLALYSEAAGASTDERLRRAAADLWPRVQARWSSSILADAMRAIDASLLSIGVAQSATAAADAVDALERVIGVSYRPGEGVSRQVGASPFVRGGEDDQTCAASALLTAHALTARLPYGMLADELMQGVLRRGAYDPEAPFAARCDAARVFCRLAALHRDEDYRRTAVLAEATDYAAQAGLILCSLEAAAHRRGIEAAPYGIALAQWLELQ